MLASLPFAAEVAYLAVLPKAPSNYDPIRAKDKAMARRNKLLGLWAAEKMGLKGADAESYAKEVVKSDLQEAGDDDVLRKVKGDLEARGLSFSEHQIRREMDELLGQARDQIRNGV